MPNQRKEGVERVTLTLPEDLLRLAEIEADRRKVDRLQIIREALSKHLLAPKPKPKTITGYGGSKR